MEKKYLTITISKDGKKTEFDAENFHGVGCTKLLDEFAGMGSVLIEKDKPELMDRDDNNNVLENSY